jgi:hypothetical protein
MKVVLLISNNDNNDDEGGGTVCSVIRAVNVVIQALQALHINIACSVPACHTCELAKCQCNCLPPCNLFLIPAVDGALRAPRRNVSLNVEYPPY